MSANPIPRTLFSHPCSFVAGVTNLEQMPEMTLPEIVFCGRSNVGKSSLVNALLGRKSLVRTSSTPGHTRQLNFFNLNEMVMLVDVPGYGYAKAPKHLIKGWQELLFTYLRGRSQILRVLVLIDARQGVKPGDEEMMKLLDNAAQPYQLVLTKIDKAKKEELDKAIASVEKAIAKHPAAFPSVITTSSEAKQGIDALQTSLLEALDALTQGTR